MLGAAPTNRVARPRAYPCEQRRNCPEFPTNTTVEAREARTAPATSTSESQFMHLIAHHALPRVVTFNTVHVHARFLRQFTIPPCPLSFLYTRLLSLDVTSSKYIHFFSTYPLNLNSFIVCSNFV